MHVYFINRWQSKFANVDVESKLKANTEDHLGKANFDAVIPICIGLPIVTLSKTEVSDYMNSPAERDSERK